MGTADPNWLLCLWEWAWVSAPICLLPTCRRGRGFSYNRCHLGGGEIDGKCTLLNLLLPSFFPVLAQAASKGIAKLLFISEHEVWNYTEQVESLRVLHLWGKGGTAKHGEDRTPRCSCLSSSSSPLSLLSPLTTSTPDFHYHHPLQPLLLFLSDSSELHFSCYWGKSHCFQTVSR